MRKFTFLIRRIALICLSVMAVSCNNELHMSLPQGPEGPQGEDGLSAYEVWVKAIEDGTIEWDGNTDIVDFFFYLKGSDGADGSDGSDGANGQSAYELWVSEVEAGNITDKSGDDWLDNHGTTVADFWLYLTGSDGADGQSAYDLWVEEVGKGNIYDKEGNPWDSNSTTIDDFWDYLRGADGEDGKVDGTTIVLGYYNVIARYYQSGTNYAEYVDATNGNVKYTVYDKTGAIAPGAIVNTITYIDGSGNTQTIIVNETANVDGNIWLSIDMLPTVAGTELTENCQAIVTTTGSAQETAYANTIVPTKPQISVEFSSITLSSSTQYFYVRIQRSMDGGTTWENIPSYLATPSSAYVRYYVVDVTSTPVDLSYTGTAAASKAASDMSNTVYAIITRPKVKTSYTTTGTYTGVSDEKYYAAYLDSLYGQTAHSSEVALLTPINQVPRLENLTASNESYDSGKGAYVLYGFSGDFKVSDIDQTLISISVTKDTSYTPARWKYVPLTTSELTTASMLQLYTSRSFTDCTVYEYSKTCNIYNVNTGDPMKTGFNDMTLYNGATLYINGNSYIYNSYTYTVSRTSDATTATWTFTSSGLTDSYKTQTVQVADCGL